MKKALTLFIATVLVITAYCQQPILWGMATSGGTSGNGTVFNMLGNGNKFNVAFNFPGNVQGAAPTGVQLCQASNGLLYGMAGQGGANGDGVIFSYDPVTGNYTDVVDFTDDQPGAPGANASGSLIQASNGLLYGMTQNGGTQEFEEGVIFSLDPVSGTYTDLYEFTGGSTGNTPYGSLMQASNGLLYGLTTMGGNSGQGDLFSFDPGANTFTELSDFGTISSSFGDPQGTLVQASNGLLYGTAYGANGSNGQLFSYNITGNSVSVLVSFTGTTGSYKGANPLGALTIGADGLLYGETTAAGANGDGVLFSYKISPATYTKLYDFTSAPPCGDGLMQANNNLLYGYKSDGEGSLFSYNISTSTYNNVYSFFGPSGQSPSGALFQASNGLMYGVATVAGAGGEGTLFSLSTAGVFNLILSFQSPSQLGSSPWGNLIKAKNGKLYGMCVGGGAYNQGTLFSIDPVSYNMNIYSFNGDNGCSPYGSVVQASNGLLYGMTNFGGTQGDGAIFSFDPSNPNNQPVNVYSFTGAAPDYGYNPQSSLIQASNGLLYGMSVSGGTYGQGNIFSFDPANPSNPAVDIYDFTSGSPFGDLMQASNGLLYGMTTFGGIGIGNIFSLNTTDNTYTDLYDFTGAAPDYASTPYQDLIQAQNGLLYGLTNYGGTVGFGNIFSFDPAHPSNPPVDLVDFGNQGYPGTNPGGTLMQGTDGYLYGMTYGDGANFDGVLFKYNYTTGNYTDVHDFDYTDGANPWDGAFVQTGVTPADTFLGYTTDWMTPSNWSTNTVPDSTTDVVILSHPVGGNFPQITYQGATQDIQLQDGATLDLGRDGLLSVYGFWMGGSTTTSTVTGPGGVVQFVSTLPQQQIAGITAFQTVLLNNAGTTAGGNAVINIYNQLNIQAGQFYTLGNQSTITLKATSSSSYAILQDPNANYFGPITAECFYDLPTTADSYSQHMMGSPVDAPFLSQFGATYVNNGYITDANCDETKIDNNSPYGNVFQYNEANGASCEVDQWYVMSSEDQSTDGQGYSVVLTGSGVLSVTGWPNNYASYTTTGSNSNWSNHSLQNRPYNSGWVLMSNPYPAPLVISPASISQNVASGWDAQIQVWNTTGTNAGSYQPTTVLAPFQGFMAHITHPGGATYTINASDQVYNTNPTFYKQAANEQLTVTATNTTTGLTDNTTVGFSTLATDTFDPAIDINKFPGQLTRHTLYTTNLDTNQWMCNNILYSIAQTGSVPMGFEPGVSGDYTLHFDGVTSFDATSYLTLQDNQLGTTYDIRTGDYSYTAGSTDNWNRFVLLFTPAAQVATTNATCNTAGTLNIVQPGIANWNYTLTDASNTQLSTGALNSSTPININLVAGVYTLTLKDGNGYTVVKSIQVNGDPSITAAFNAADTAQVNQGVDFTSTSTNTNTNSWNFGDGNTGTGNAVTHTYTTPGTYTVILTSTNDSGCTAITSHTIIIKSTTVGVQNLTTNNIRIWSNGNMVNVSFGAISDVTTVKIYNELGQQLVNDQLTSGNLYAKTMNNIATGYLIVMVNDGQKITTGKVFISNSK